MMIAALNTAGGVLNIAGSVGGVPLVGVAGITLQEIVLACDNVKINKVCMLFSAVLSTFMRIQTMQKKSKQLSNKCMQIINMLNEQESQMEGTEIQKIADQLLPYVLVS